MVGYAWCIHPKASFTHFAHTYWMLKKPPQSTSTLSRSLFLGTFHQPTSTNQPRYTICVRAIPYTSIYCILAEKMFSLPELTIQSLPTSRSIHPANPPQPPSIPNCVARLYQWMPWQSLSPWVLLLWRDCSKIPPTIVVARGVLAVVQRPSLTLAPALREEAAHVVRMDQATNWKPGRVFFHWLKRYGYTSWSLTAQNRPLKSNLAPKVKRKGIRLPTIILRGQLVYHFSLSSPQSWDQICLYKRFNFKNSNSRTKKKLGL